MEISIAKGVLCDNDILSELEMGNIIIHPFNKQHLANCSYDITLGENYYRSNPKMTQLNPWNENQIKEYWGEYLKANTASKENAEQLGLSVGDKFIRILPGELILAHTNEFIGGKNHLVTMMKARSSLMRSCICTCSAAGWGDVGFCSKWTMEIYNYSTSVEIILPVGRRVGQIIFLYTGIPSRTYASKGKYQTSDHIQEIMDTWTPEAMLPKLYKD
ncbi:dCTP deaminase [soil metagenome]